MTKFLNKYVSYFVQLANKTSVLSYKIFFDYVATDILTRRSPGKVKLIFFWFFDTLMEIWVGKNSPSFFLVNHSPQESKSSSLLNLRQVGQTYGGLVGESNKKSKKVLVKNINFILSFLFT